MNKLLLLKLIADLLKENNPNSLKTAQKILENMIKEMETHQTSENSLLDPILDNDANQAKRELLNG